MDGIPRDLQQDSQWRERNYVVPLLTDTLEPKWPEHMPWRIASYECEDEGECVSVRATASVSVSVSVP